MRMSEYMEELLHRLNEIDPDLASDIREEYWYEMAQARGEAKVSRAKAHLQDMMELYDDPTGQDLECPAVENAARDYIDAQNELIRETDPDRYSEMKYMGLL
jgi:hypothetical protein